MSSTPNNTGSLLTAGYMQALPSFIAAEKTWLQKHERLLLGAALLLVSLWLGNKYINHSASIADAKSAAAQQQLVLDKQQMAALQAAYEQDRTTLASQIQQLIAANMSLSKSVVDSEHALENAKAKVPNMSPTQLSTTWQQEIQLPNVTPAPNGSYVVGQAEAVATVQKLETADALALQKKDLQQEVANDQKHVEDLNKLNTDQTGLLLQSQKQLVDADKACTLKVDAVKDDARKSKRNWFIGGLSAGIAIALKIAKF